MSAPILIVALGEDASWEIRHQLDLEPLNPSSPLSLWISHGPLLRTMSTLRESLQNGVARSAALLPEVPSRDRLWLVTEWRGRLVITEDFLPLMKEREGWEVESRYERENLLVLSPVKAREKTNQVQEVESPEEYQNSLFSEKPVVARLRMAVLDKERGGWQRWFGELAEPETGGAVALLALSGARPESTDILLRNPAALGLKVARDDASALSTYCRRKKLEVVAYGGRWGEFERQTMALEHHDHLTEEFMVQTRNELHRTSQEAHTTSYYILLGVEAIDDPEVVIPTGAIFEQSSLNGVQTLATANSRKFQIDVGQFLPIALPAWCLNRSLSAPAGEPVRPTPLVYPGGGGGQGAVWDDIAQRLSETSL